MSKFVKIFALIATFGFLGNAFANDAVVAEPKADVATTEVNADAVKDVAKSDVKVKKHAKKHVKHIKKLEKEEANLEAEVKKDEAKEVKIKEEIKKEEVK